MSIRDDFRYTFKKPDAYLQWLILINVSVFLFLVLNRLFLGNNAGMINSHFTMPLHFDHFLTRPWTLITNIFSHERLGHLFWNMIALYWFGLIIRDFLGGAKIVSLYVLGGLAGALLAMLLYSTLPRFALDYRPLLGASGGVFAIIVGAAVLVPDYMINLLFVGPVKMKYVAMGFLVIGILLQANNQGGMMAHAGGAGIGALYVIQLRKGTDLGKWIISFLDWVKNLFKPKAKMKVSYKSTRKDRKAEKAKAKAAKTEQQTDSGVSQEEIDKILDKISQSGYESLTREEKEKLFKASKK